LCNAKLQVLFCVFGLNNSKSHVFPIHRFDQNGIGLSAIIPFEFVFIAALNANVIGKPALQT
jgi:hypothetical protein